MASKRGGPRLLRLLWIIPAVAWAGACGGVSSGVGGESHFVCKSQADCDARRPGDVCFRADPNAANGECVSESSLRDAATHLNTGGVRGAGGAPSIIDAGTAGATQARDYCGAPQR